MEKITIGKEEPVKNGFQQLIEAKKSGKEAKWEFGGIVTTTDMVPERFEYMQYDAIAQEMKRNAMSLKMDLIEKNTGRPFINSEVKDADYYAMFEEYEQENAKKENKVM